MVNRPDGLTRKNLAQLIYSNRQTKLQSTIYKNMTQHRKLNWKNTTYIDTISVWVQAKKMAHYHKSPKYRVGAHFGPIVTFMAVEAS